MSEYLKIRNQIVKLQRQAEILRKRERTEAIARIRETIAAYEFTAEDLGLASSNHTRRGPRAVAGIKPQHPTEKLSTETNQRRSGVGRKSSVTDKRGVVAPKYRDSTTGATWTGRGKQPKWLAAEIKGGRKLEDFKI